MEIRAFKTILAITLACLISSCSLGFIPLIPKKVELEPRIVLSPDSRLERQGTEILLSLDLQQVPEEGFLAAYLYRNETKIFEDSKLIDPKSSHTEFRFSPAQLGEYRAVLFWQGNIVRQFELSLK